MLRDQRMRRVAVVAGDCQPLRSRAGSALARCRQPRVLGNGKPLALAVFRSQLDAHPRRLAKREPQRGNRAPTLAVYRVANSPANS